MFPVCGKFGFTEGQLPEVTCTVCTWFMCVCQGVIPLHKVQQGYLYMHPCVRHWPDLGSETKSNLQISRSPSQVPYIHKFMCLCVVDML